MYIIHIKSLYQNPPDQGFHGHYFKLRELRSDMQHFFHTFRSFHFQSNYTSNLYYSHQILISDSFRSRLTGSILQTQGTSWYYATFLSKIPFLPLLVTIGIERTSFILNPHIRILQNKASAVTTSNAGNYKVLCNISLTNFIPVASNYIRHHNMYIIHIKSSYEIPPDRDF